MTALTEHTHDTFPSTRSPLRAPPWGHQTLAGICQTILVAPNRLHTWFHLPQRRVMSTATAPPNFTSPCTRTPHSCQTASTQCSTSVIMAPPPSLRNHPVSPPPAHAPRHDGIVTTHTTIHDEGATRWRYPSCTTSLTTATPLVSPPTGTHCAQNSCGHGNTHCMLRHIARRTRYTSNTTHAPKHREREPFMEAPPRERQTHGAPSVTPPAAPLFRQDR